MRPAPTASAASPRASSASARLAVDAPVEVRRSCRRRASTGPAACDRPRLARGVLADERDRVGVRWVVLDVARARRRRTGSGAARGSRRAGARSTRGRAASTRRATATRRGRTAPARDERSPSSPSRARRSRRASVAKSPRIVPGAESAGFVAPIIVRTPAIASSPRDREREDRAGGDEVDELAEERLALVLGVVLARERLRDPEQPRAAQLVAAPLEPREDLAAERRAGRRPA